MGLFAEVLRGVRPLGGGEVEGSESESEMEEEGEEEDDEGADESLLSEGSVRRDPVAKYDGGNDAMAYGGLGIQISRSSTPRGRRSANASNASLSPSESWVSLSAGSFASGGSVVRHPELGSGVGGEEVRSYDQN